MKNSTRIAWNVLLLGLAVTLVPAPARAQVDTTSYGSGALPNNTTGDYNSAFGVNALRLNTTGSGNTALGRGAMYKNVSGESNTAVGFGAMYYNTGSDNVAVRALAAGNQPRDGRLGKAADQSHSQHAAMLGTWGGAMTLLGAAMALLHLKRRTASGKPTS